MIYCARAYNNNNNNNNIGPLQYCRRVFQTYTRYTCACVCTAAYRREEDPSIPPEDIKHGRSSAKITVYSRTSLIDSSGRKIKPIKYVVNRHLGLDDDDDGLGEER